MAVRSLSIVHQTTGHSLNIRSTYRKLYLLLGAETISVIYRALFWGMLLLLIEFIFAFCLQALLYTLGLIGPESLTIPIWAKPYLHFTTWLFGILAILRFAVGISKTYYESIIAETFKCSQRSQITRVFLDYTTDSSTGEIVALFTDEMERASSTISVAVSALINSLSLALCIILLLNLAWKETLTAFAILSISIFPMKLSTTFFKNAGEGVALEWKKINETLISSLKNRIFLNLYGMVDSTNKELINGLRAQSHEYKKYRMGVSLLGSMPNFFGLMIVTIIIHLSSSLYKTPGSTLLTFFYIFLRAVQALMAIQNAKSAFNFTYPSLKKVMELIEILSTYDPPQTNVNIKKAETISVAFDNVLFKYKGQATDLLKNLSFQLKTGECLVIQGASGVGKSTVLMLLVGILKPNSGNITVNGLNPSINRDSLVRQIAYVGPDPYLIPGTIYDNLLYGHETPEEVNQAQLAKALDDARLTKLIDDVPNGINYYLHENAKLSTGQKQRIAIARAFLREAPILILDESTSNLDLETEQEIISILEKLIKNKAVVIISHRNSYNYLATQKILLT